jgi:hypothetical protein
MLPRRVLTGALIFIVAAGAMAQAQIPAEAPPPTPAQFDAPAYVAVVDGAATLERDGRIETAPLNMPLVGGDKLRTTDGRVEVRFADGGRLMLDSHTSVDLLSNALARLGEGRVRVNVVRGGSQQVSYRVDSPAGSARIFQPGEYRVAVLHGAPSSPGIAGEEVQLEFSVISGGGEIATEQGTTPVRAGERAYASAGLLPSYAYAYNSAEGDDFDHWVDTQHDVVYAASSPSAQYLPADMTSYASTFDQYGDWRYQQSYGYVWYPHVAADWHPYYNGSWMSYPTYGWTWIAADRFGYPTHHYGRWGVSAGLWFWIPSAAWGPAYVSWAYAPDYVSWCPLGYNNSAAFSIGYYNLGPAYYSSHYHGHYYAAWTTVPHGYFGHGYAYQHAVNWDHVNTGVRPHFTEGRSPAAGTSAVARATTAAPLRSAGTRASTQPAANSTARVAGRPAQAGFNASRSPRYINRGNEIVRSQTAQPIAPRDNAVTRTAPAPVSGQGAAAGRQPRAWDNPSYRPPNYNPPAPNSPVERTMPRAMVQASPRYDPALPRQPAAAAQRPSAPEYSHPSAGYARPAPPSGGSDHAAPRSSGGSSHVETHAPSGAGVARSRGGKH